MHELRFAMKEPMWIKKTCRKKGSCTSISPVFSIRCSKEQRISKILLPSFFGGKIIRGPVEPLQNYENPWGNLHVKNRCQDGRGNGAGEATAGKSLIFNSCISSGLQLFQRTSSQPVLSLGQCPFQFPAVDSQELAGCGLARVAPPAILLSNACFPNGSWKLCRGRPRRIFRPGGRTPTHCEKHSQANKYVCCPGKSHCQIAESKSLGSDLDCGIQVTWIPVGRCHEGTSHVTCVQGTCHIWLGHVTHVSSRKHPCVGRRAGQATKIAACFRVLSALCSLNLKVKRSCLLGSDSRSMQASPQTRLLFSTGAQRRKGPELLRATRVQPNSIFPPIWCVRTRYSWLGTRGVCRSGTFPAKMNAPASQVRNLKTLQKQGWKNPTWDASSPFFSGWNNKCWAVAWTQKNVE